VPPAIKGSTLIGKTLVAEIEKICDEAIVICGVLKKQIKYDAVVDSNIERHHIIVDEIPFTCVIDREDISADDQFIIHQLKVLCEVSGKEENFTTDSTSGNDVAFRFVEKDLIKICVKKLNE
jgi:hypothetical protein